MKMGNAISVSILANVSIFCQTNVMEYSSTMIYEEFFHIILADHHWLVCKKILWRKKKTFIFS